MAGMDDGQVSILGLFCTFVKVGTRTWFKIERAEQTGCQQWIPQHSLIELQSALTVCREPTFDVSKLSSGGAWLNDMILDIMDVLFCCFRHGPRIIENALMFLSIVAAWLSTLYHLGRSNIVL